MSVVLRADDVPPAARRAYVREVVGAAFGPIDVRLGDGDELPDQVRAADLGVLRVGELSASRPGGADRTRRHIRAMDDDLCKVDVVAQGEVVLEQDGRHARLTPVTSRSSTSPVRPTGPTPGRRGWWRSPSPAGCSRSAATASAA